MEWSALLVPEAIPQLAAATVMVGLAAWLVYLAPAHRPGVAFALFLVMRACRMFAGVAQAFAPDYEDQAFWANVGPYFSIAALPALAYFAVVYPWPLPGLGTGRWSWIPFAAAGLVLESVYVWDHALDWTFAPDEGGDLAVTALGPLNLAGTLVLVAFGALALLFAWRFLRSRDRARHTSLLLVAVAFELNALYDSTGILLGTSPNVIRPGNVWSVVGRVLYLFELAPAGAAAALLFIAWRRETSAATRGTIGRLLLLVPLPVLSNLASWAFDAPLGVDRFLNGVWRLSLPLLVTYALVRHQLFDIDLKVKVTLRRGTVAGAFVAVFFVASEGAATYFTSRTGSNVLGLAAAGLLVFAIHPLQRLGERIADATLPGVRDTPAWRKRRREEAFRSALEFVLSDGKITIEEHRRLDRLAQRLRLTEDESSRVRRDVERALGWRVQERDKRPAATRRTA